MKKTFVLDTSVLVQSPESIFSFEEHDVVVAEAVINELDELIRKEEGEKKENALQATKLIRQLSDKHKTLSHIPLNEEGGRLFVEMNHRDERIPDYWDKRKSVSRSLQVCLGLKTKERKQVIFVTRQDSKALMARFVGVDAEDYENEKAPDNQYTGRITLYCDNDYINLFHKLERRFDAGLELKNMYDEHGNLFADEIMVNQFVHLKGSNEQNSALGVFNGEVIRPLIQKGPFPMGINSKNIAQRFILEALFLSISEAPLVIIKGPSGTAKTFLSVAAGIAKLFESPNEKDREFLRILICRPSVMMDENLGFLPGSEREKVDPYMRPIYDNLAMLLSKKNDNKDSAKLQDSKVDYYMKQGIIDMQSIGYLRGRSLFKHYVLIDEAQNATPTQAKGIITRAGEGSKIIMTGDIDQIDHKYLDKQTNGLSYASEKMKGSPLCYQITFTEDESIRSPLALEAIKRL